jgi:hypothetical protein
MDWLFWLIVALVIAALAAIFGVQPKGGRKVSGTSLMSVGRFVLALFLLILAYAVYRAHAGGG